MDSPVLAQLPDPIATRQQVFTIPFTVNPRETPPAEVRLYVSADGGATWKFYQRQSPDSGGFHFRAAEDGDYCFAVWTVQERSPVQESSPAAINSALRAELRVVVDTVLPDLEFTANVGHAGELRAKWTASDAHLSPNPLKIEYRTGGSAWKGVALPPPAGARSLQVQGEVSWWAEPASDGMVEVRAILEDQAGNTRDIVHRVAVAQRLPPQGPVGPAENSAQRWQPSATDKPLSPHAAGGWTAAGGSDAVPSTAESNSAALGPAGPPDRPAGTAALPVSLRNKNLREVEEPLTRMAEASPSSEGGTAFTVQSPAADEYKLDRQVSQLPPTYSPDEGGSKYGAPLPLPADVRLSQSRTFDLTYDLRHLSPGSAEKVDLWSTLDDGATWVLQASDDDCVSPMRVQVNQERLHGFRLVVQTRDGLSGAAPGAGDKPDFQVLTDWTRPTAEITSVEYGQGTQQGNLVVRWTASDANLSRTPIRLEYAQSVSGPWNLIATSLENSGFFTWRVDAAVPEEVLLRIQAEDHVGNYATNYTKHPIRTAPLRPQVQILDVRPIEEAPGL
ncbi:MAG: hypothetical protein O3C60_08030 [Planctomycetota bacterium]|nr:hypothetical protein [Planctomycetota bacterium]